VNQVVFRPAKLLIAMVSKYSGEFVLAAAKRGRGGTKAMGRSMAQPLPGGGITGEPVTECVIFIMMHCDEADGVVREILQASLEHPEHFKGIAVVVNAAAMLLASTVENAPNAKDARERAERDRMESGNTLITAIISHGQADEIMRVARQAGARGGTILNARGTGTEDDVKFFGISLAPEKEMLLIVAENRDKNAILEAVGKLSIFSKPGGGVVYTQNVEQFIVLGQ